MRAQRTQLAGQLSRRPVAIGVVSFLTHSSNAKAVSRGERTERLNATVRDEADLPGPQTYRHKHPTGLASGFGKDVRAIERNVPSVRPRGAEGRGPTAEG